jgi:hypothetical protein
MVPDVNRPEWEKLVTGIYTPKLTSLSLQLKINALRNELKNKKCDVRSAVIELHNYCKSNESLVQKDFPLIFI